jgi:flagellar basal body-associated protein FliL
MNTKYLVIVAALAVMMIGATALAIEDAFATKKKEYSQATSQVNNCGNEFEPEDVFCQNLVSQIQGDENAPALAGAQGED